MITLFLILLIIALNYAKIKSWIRISIVSLRLRGPKSYPILGTILSLNDEDMLEYSVSAHEQFGPVFRTWLFVIPVMFTFDPKVIQILLSKSKQTNKSFFYTFMHTFLGEGLITNNGRKWKLHRKLIQPYFRKSILDQFVPTFYNVSKNIVVKLKGKTKLNVGPYVNQTVLNILHESVLGISKDDIFNYPELKDSPFRKGRVNLTYRLFRPWYLLNSLYSNSNVAKSENDQKYNLQEYVKKVLVLRRQGKLKGGKCQSLMEMFIDISNQNAEFSDNAIVNEIATFMLAGQDSVGAAVAFSLYFLAKHKDFQDFAREEIDSVLKNKEFDAVDLDNLKYLDQCIKETLRLCPSVPIISRSLDEDTQIGEYTYPKNTIFCIVPFGTHRLKHIYPDPERYDPDRFTSENEEKLPPFSYIPFSAGPRNCIGYKFAMMEIKTILALILKNYNLSIPSDYKLAYGYRVTLRAHGGIWINCLPRNQEINTQNF